MEQTPETSATDGRNTVVRNSIAAVVVLTAIVIAAALGLQDKMNSTEVAPTGDAPAKNGNGNQITAGLLACPVPENADAGAGTSKNAGTEPQALSGVTLECLGQEATGTDLQTSLAGKPAVINMWAWDCVPCRQELPLFGELQGRIDATVVGVHANSNATKGIEFMQQLISEGHTPVPSWQDNDGRYQAALKLPNVVPQTLVLRADGTVAATYPKVFTTVDELEEAYNSAMAGGGK